MCDTDLHRRNKIAAFVISRLWATGKTDNAVIGNQRRRKHKKENCKWDHGRKTEEATRNVVEIEKNINCPTNLPVHKRRRKKEVEIRRNINYQNPLVLSLSLRRWKKEVVETLLPKPPRQMSTKIIWRLCCAHMRIPLNRNSSYAPQSRGFW